MSDIIKLDMVASELDGKSPDLRLPYEDKAPITDPLVQHRAHLSRAQFSQSLGSHVRECYCAHTLRRALEALIPTGTKDVHAGESRDATLYRNIEEIENTANDMRAVAQSVISVGLVSLVTKITVHIWISGLCPCQ